MLYHWADIIAKKAIDERGHQQVIATGTSLSGEPHIGNANDVIRGYAVYKALKEKVNAKIVWIADDMDPFRSVPLGFPADFYDFLGKPVCFVPDPHGCHDSLVKHYENLFLQEIKRLKISIEPLFGVGLYESGRYDPYKYTAMEKREEIIRILSDVTGADISSSWYPIDVICPKCGKISTTRIISYDKQKKTAHIICSEEEKILHKKHPVKGCGFEGDVVISGKKAKLKWRVEWPARWSFLKVTVEPFGKEHSASGGSYDSSKEIVKLFNWQAPVPVIYEHYQMSGEKMSKSKGNIVTVSEFLRLVSPEELRFYMYFERIGKARNIDLSTLPPFIATEYDRSERIYFNEEKCDDEKERRKRARSYELANEKITKKIQVPYQFCAVLAQIYPLEQIISILHRSGFIPSDIGEEDRDYVMQRVKRAKYWVETYAPENKKIKLLKEPKILLSAEEKLFVKRVYDYLSSKEVWRGEEIQSDLFDIIKSSGLPVKRSFSIIYQMFLGRNNGPRIGPFISFLDKGYVLSMLKKVI